MKDSLNMEEDNQSENSDQSKITQKKVARFRPMLPKDKFNMPS